MRSTKKKALYLLAATTLLALLSALPAAAAPGGPCRYCTLSHGLALCVPAPEERGARHCYLLSMGDEEDCNLITWCVLSEVY